MNRNLLIFGLLLIVLGIGFDFYLLSFFGLLLLIPAALSPSRTAGRQPQTPTRPAPTQEPRRIIPLKPKPEAQPTPLEVKDAPLSPQLANVQTFQPGSSYPAYSPALFPNSIFPPVSSMGSSQPMEPEAATKPAQRDELVEAGAIIALLRILLG